MNSVRDLLIDTPDGGKVRLAEVADVRIVPTPNVIQREGFSRRIDVAANVRGRDLGAVSGDVAERLKNVEFSLGYHSQLLGEYAERQAAQSRMLVAWLVTAVMIFLLLTNVLQKLVAGGTRVFGPAGGAGWRRFLPPMQVTASFHLVPLSVF